MPATNYYLKQLTPFTTHTQCHTHSFTLCTHTHTHTHTQTHTHTHTVPWLNMSRGVMAHLCALRLRCSCLTPEMRMMSMMMKVDWPMCKTAAVVGWPSEELGCSVCVPADKEESVWMCVCVCVCVCLTLGKGTVDHLSKTIPL